MIPYGLRSFGLCSWCHAYYQPTGRVCPDCLYPYHNVEYLRAFDDLKAFHFYPPVGFAWFQDYQTKLGQLPACSFCGGQANFDIRSEFIPERDEFHDICEISCIGGCTNTTAWLFLYDFDFYHSLLLIAWLKGIRRLPLILHSDLKLPSFISSLPAIQRKTKYAKGLYKTSKPTQSVIQTQNGFLL